MLPDVLPILDYPALVVDTLVRLPLVCALVWLGGVVMDRMERESSRNPLQLPRIPRQLPTPTRLHIATETSDEPLLCEVCHLPLRTRHVVRLWDDVSRVCVKCEAWLTGRNAA